MYQNKIKAYSCSHISASFHDGAHFSEVTIQLAEMFHPSDLYDLRSFTFKQNAVVKIILALAAINTKTEFFSFYVKLHN